MENTDKIFFKDEKPQWYIAQGTKHVGPMTAADVHARIVAKEITTADYVWKPGQKAWQRICDTKEFEVIAPKAPPKSVPQLAKETKAAPSKTASKKGPSEPYPLVELEGISSKADPKKPCWFLYYNESQFGPFSQEEILRFMSIGKIHGRVHAWKDGLAGWQRLEAVAEFKDAAKKAQPKASGPKDKRSAPRQPLVAKILLANTDTVIVGICRDISVGGMQVLTDQVPGAVGAKIKLNVSPAGEAQGKPIEPFVASGEIVRILEDGRGFSFRFERLPESSKQVIERYLARG